MSLVFAVEPLESAWDEMLILAKLHWTETHGNASLFKPEFDLYNQYAKVGWFLQFTVRDNGKMVGFAGIYIVRSMHTQEKIATEDTWFLLPDYRKGWNAIRFYKYMEKICISQGVSEINLTIPLGKEAARRMMDFLDYEEITVQYRKIIGCADSAFTHAVTEGNSDVRTQTTSCP